MKRFHGIYPALITPFTKEGYINTEALRKLVRINMEKGVNGFYVGGSTAEAFLLTLEERKQILEIVSEEAKENNYVVIFQVGSISTKEAITLAKYAEELKIDAISAVPPFYYNFSLEEIKGYYKDILNSVNLPMIIYNIPAFSNVDLNITNFKDLFQDDRVIGIKYTSHDLYQLERIKEFNDSLIVLNGYDEVFLASLAMGADGAIGSTYNFMAEKFIKIKQYYKEGKLDEAKKLQKEANNIIKALIEVGVYPGIKYILKLQGIDCGECRKPFKTLTNKEKEYIRSVYERNI